MIRKATIKDLRQIEQIHEMYVFNVSRINDKDYKLQAEKEGFTVSPGKTNILKRIKNSQIFNVYEENGKIIGYIEINREIYFPKEAKNIVWLEKDLKDIYFNEAKSIALHHLAVIPAHKRKGIASKLLNHAISQLKKKKIKHLFSIITTGPVTNFPSIFFHTKMGFRKVCETKPINLFGLNDYESALYYLQL